MIFTLVYNLPKFFELYVKKDVMLKSVDCLEIMENQSYIEYRHNCTTTTDDWEDQKVNVTVLDHNDEPQYKISITATDLRINRIYIRVYILWLNLIVQIIVPFVLLTVLNILTYKKIVEFEQNLSNQMRERNTRPSMRRVTSQRVRSQDGEENDTEMIQLVSEQEEDQEEEISRSGNLLQRIKSKLVHLFYLLAICCDAIFCTIDDICVSLEQFVIDLLYPPKRKNYTAFTKKKSRYYDRWKYGMFIFSSIFRHTWRRH